MADPVRIKAGEKFAVTISVPKVDCICGNPWENLFLCEWDSGMRDKQGQPVRGPDGNFIIVRHFHLTCLRCGRFGPDEPERILAMLAWAGKISRERVNDQG